MMYRDEIMEGKDQYLFYCNTMDFHSVQPPPPTSESTTTTTTKKEKKKQTSLSVFKMTISPWGKHKNQ